MRPQTMSHLLASCPIQVHITTSHWLLPGSLPNPSLPKYFEDSSFKQAMIAAWSSLVWCFQSQLSHLHSIGIEETRDSSAHSVMEHMVREGENVLVMHVSLFPKGRHSPYVHICHVPTSVLMLAQHVSLGMAVAVGFLSRLLRPIAHHVCPSVCSCVSVVE